MNGAEESARVEEAGKSSSRSSIPIKERARRLSVRRGGSLRVPLVTQNVVTEIGHPTVERPPRTTQERTDECNKPTP